MYFVSVVALMLVCPLTSIGIQILLGGPGMLTAAVVSNRFMAKRMGAKTIEVKASHLSLISHPD